MIALFPYEYSFASPIQLARMKKMDDLECQINDLQIRVNNIVKCYGKMKNNADLYDYWFAFSSGVLSAAIHIFWVGKFDFARGRIWAGDKVNNMVTEIAKWQGYSGDNLEGAIRYLEKEFPIAADTVTKEMGGGLQHHIRDFSHHPTPIGLMFSLLTQFTEKVFGTNTLGAFIVVQVPNTTLIGNDIYEKFTYGVIYWFFHMISDMAGSSATPGNGTGLPGPLISLLKEISALPFFQLLKDGQGNSEFSVLLSKLFNGTLLAERDNNGKIIPESVNKFKLDLRGEIGVAYELERQAVPVIINECIVRAFYFIRQFTREIEENNISRFCDLKCVDWRAVLPFKNGTVNRMLTISSGVLSAITVADAYCRRNVMRVNFVGLVRFGLALIDDLSFEKNLAKQYRIDIEQTCTKIRKLLNEYELELRTYIDDYLIDHISAFNDAFERISRANESGDADAYIESVNGLTRKLGGEVQFSTVSELKSMVRSGRKIII